SSAIFLMGADVVRAASVWERSSSGRRWSALLPWHRTRTSLANGASGTADRAAQNGNGSLRAFDADGSALLAPVSAPASASVSASALPNTDRSSLAAPPPARSHFSAKRNFEASHEPSRGDEKASPERHAGITKVLNLRTLVIIPALMLLGIWSRIEVVAFVGVLLLVLLLVYRRQAIALAVTYTVAALVVTGSLLFVYRLENVDLGQAWFCTAHTL